MFIIIIMCLLVCVCVWGGGGGGVVTFVLDSDIVVKLISCLEF